MTTIGADDPRSVALGDAIRGGDVAGLEGLLRRDPALATAGIESGGEGAGVRTSLHVATDWPGRFPRVASTIAVLVDAGASVDAPFVGRHAERPLHWAASSDDVVALDALLDAGADIDAPGSVEWVAPWDGSTPADAAARVGASELAALVRTWRGRRDRAGG